MFVDLGSIPTVAQDGKRYQGETSALFQSVGIHVEMDFARDQTCVHV